MSTSAAAYIKTKQEIKLQTDEGVYENEIVLVKYWTPGKGLCKSLKLNKSTVEILVYSRTSGDPASENHRGATGAKQKVAVAGALPIALPALKNRHSK